MVSSPGRRVWAAAAFSLLLASCFPGDRPIAQRMACAGDTCACMAGYDNCDGEPYNGCETDLSLDPRHCGSCGVRCDNGQCVDAECVPSQDYVNCNEGWHDGFEAHLQSDPENCGACGNDCMGGTCGNGRCEPFLVVEPGLWIRSLTADATHLYFCEYWTESIMRVSQAGGDIEVLAVDQGCYGGPTVAGDAVYWISEVGQDSYDSLIVQGSVTGENVTIIDTAESAWSIRAKGDTVAWGATADDGTDDKTIVVRSGASDTPTEVYRTPLSLGALALAGDHVYVIEYDGTTDDPMRLMSLPVGGGVATELTELGSAGVDHLTATDEHLYWIEWVGANPDDDEYKVMRLALGDAAPVALYSGHNRESYDVSSVPMHADSSGAYWAEQEGIRLLHLPFGSDEVQLLAQYQEVESLTAGPAALFWQDDPAKLLGLAKKAAP